MGYNALIFKLYVRLAPGRIFTFYLFLEAAYFQPFDWFPALQQSAAMWPGRRCSARTREEVGMFGRNRKGYRVTVLGIVSDGGLSQLNTEGKFPECGLLPRGTKASDISGFGELGVHNSVKCQ